MMDVLNSCLLRNRLNHTFLTHWKKQARSLVTVFKNPPIHTKMLETTINYVAPMPGLVWHCKLIHWRWKTCWQLISISGCTCTCCHWSYLIGQCSPSAAFWFWFLPSTYFFYFFGWFQGCNSDVLTVIQISIRCCRFTCASLACKDKTARVGLHSLIMNVVSLQARAAMELTTLNWTNGNTNFPNPSRKTIGYKLANFDKTK